MIPKHIKGMRSYRGGIIKSLGKKTILVNNKAKFIKELTLNDLFIFESVAYNILNKLNYKLYNKKSELISKFNNSLYKIFKLYYNFFIF